MSNNSSGDSASDKCGAEKHMLPWITASADVLVADVTVEVVCELFASFTKSYWRLDNIPLGGPSNGLCE